jgi:Tfp pilus assembly protein PilX
MRSIGRRGFILPTVLALLALSALIAAAALGDAATSAALASRLRQRQQALDAAETGLNVSWRQLAAGADPAATLELREASQPAVTVHSRLEIVERIPTGYSVNRVLAQRYRIQSVAAGAGGTRVGLEMGVTRLVGAQ